MAGIKIDIRANQPRFCQDCGLPWSGHEPDGRMCNKKQVKDARKELAEVKEAKTNLFLDMCGIRQKLVQANQLVESLEKTIELTAKVRTNSECCKWHWRRSETGFNPGMMNNKTTYNPECGRPREVVVESCSPGLIPVACCGCGKPIREVR